MNTFATNVCLHCGKKKEDHYLLRGRLPTDAPTFTYLIICTDEDGQVDWVDGYTLFEDSGLHQVRDNAEEVLRAAIEAVKAYDAPVVDGGIPDEYFEKIEALKSAIHKSQTKEI